MNPILLKVLLLAAGHFFIDFYIEILPPVMPALVEKIGMSMAMTGLLFTCVSITSAWSQPFFGFLGDRFKSKYILPLSLLWISVLMGAVGLINSYAVLLIVTCLAGIGSAVYHPLGSVAAASCSDKYKGLIMSFYVTIGTVGMTMSPLLAVWVKDFAGLEGLLLLAIPGVVVAALIAFLMGSDSTGQTAGTSNNYDKKNYDKEVMQADKERKESDRVGREQGIKWLLWLVIVMGFRIWAVRSFTVFIPIYYTQLGESEFFAARVLSVYLLSQGIGGVLGGISADKIGRNKTIIYSCAASIGVLIGFFYTSGFVSVIFLWAAAACMNSAFPVAVVLAQEVNPDNQNFASGMMMGFTFGIGGVGALVTGTITDFLGGNLGLALMTNIVALLLSLGLSLFLPGDGQKRLCCGKSMVK